MTGYTVGVDVGGTKILAAVIGPNEAVLARVKTETPATSSDELMAAVKDTIRQVLVAAEVSLGDVGAIGLGVPGVVGADGTCIWAPNCPLSGVPVAAIIRDEFGVPAAVGNDVNVGTLGEKAFGAAREFGNVFGMFVGTGIGGGLVINGKVIIGDHCLGAEVGHIRVDWEATARGDAGSGEFEYLAGRLGIERRVKEKLAAGRESVLKLGGGDERIRSGRLKKALAAGDAVVQEVLDEVAVLLGIGIVNVILIADPEAIIVGGGVVEACGDYLLPRIEDTVRKLTPPGNGRPIRIVRSALGDDAVLLGAAALARTVAAPVAGPTPVLDAGEPGRVVVGGQVYDHDIIIRADGQVKKRRKADSREVYGTAHKVAPAEVERACKKRATKLFVGTGHEGQLELSTEAAEWLKSRGIAVTCARTPEAARLFHDATGPKALLLHVTC